MWVNLSSWGQSDRCVLFSQASSRYVAIQSPYVISQSSKEYMCSYCKLKNKSIKSIKEQSESSFQRVWKQLFKKFVLFSHSWTTMTTLTEITSTGLKHRVANLVFFLFFVFLNNIKLYETNRDLPQHIYCSWQSFSFCPRSCLPTQPALLPLARLIGSRDCSRGLVDFFFLSLKSCFTFLSKI